jgi:hypothetical protein
MKKKIAAAKKSPVVAQVAIAAEAMPFISDILKQLPAKVKGLVIGKDAKGKVVRVGDVVKHVEKTALEVGVVVRHVDPENNRLKYKGEDACGVVYLTPVGAVPHLNRLSKLVVTKPIKPAVN